MAIEIERKYLVIGKEWKQKSSSELYRQGYLSTVKERTVRIRTIGAAGFLTIKGISVGAKRTEFEYEIPKEDADFMLKNLCQKPLIEKKRYKMLDSDLVWEIDEFFGENEGLILAEVELENENQKVNLPDWIGPEVTHDPRYFNSNLIKKPFTKW